jgi:hypothetical protein
VGETSLQPHDLARFRHGGKRLSFLCGDGLSGSGSGVGNLADAAARPADQIDR